MSNVVIHGFPQSSYVWTARAVCAAKGVEATFHPFDPPTNRSEEHLARHPYGKVPSFSHGDFTLYETSAIARYVDSAFEGPSLQPEGLQERARVEQWISVANSYLYREAVLGYAFAYIFPGTEDGSPDRARIDATLPKLRHTIGLVENTLSQSKWLVGESATLADYFMGPLLAVVSGFPEGKELLGGFPNVGRYMGQIFQTPAFTSTAPPRG